MIKLSDHELLFIFSRSTDRFSSCLQFSVPLGHICSGGRHWWRAGGDFSSTLCITLLTRLWFMALLNSVQMQTAVFSLVVGEVRRLQAVCSRKLSALRRSQQEWGLCVDDVIKKYLQQKQGQCSGPIHVSYHSSLIFFFNKILFDWLQARQGNIISKVPFRRKAIQNSLQRHENTLKIKHKDNIKAAFKLYRNKKAADKLRYKKMHVKDSKNKSK